MTVIRMKGFQIFKDRYGKQRCYHRKSGIPIDLEKYELGSAEFFAECERIAKLAKPKVPKSGTLGQLIKLFKETDRYNQLARRTRSDYERYFNYLKPIDDTPLHTFTPPLIVHIRDKAAKKGWRFANFIKSTLSVLFNFAIERGLIDKNPTQAVSNMKRPKNMERANRPWEDEERHIIWNALPEYMKPIVGFMMQHGIDIGDAVKMPKTKYKNGYFVGARSKTGVEFKQEVTGELRKILDCQSHSAITLFASSKGTPWTEDGLRSSFAKIRDPLVKAGKIGKGLTFKGLRHTVAVILREIGKDDRAIADMLSQKTTSMARHYSRGADLSKSVNESVKDLEAEMNRRKTKVVKL